MDGSLEVGQNTLNMDNFHQNEPNSKVKSFIRLGLTYLGSGDWEIENCGGRTFWGGSFFPTTHK